MTAIEVSVAAVTVTVVDPLTPPTLAVTVEVPGETPVTRPVLVTVAAVAIVSATIGGTPAPNEPESSVVRSQRPVAVLAIHGRADASIPYDGGRGAQSHGKSAAISVARSIRLWVDVDDCEIDPQIELMSQGRIERQAWSGCRKNTEVVLYSINNWGHDWPKDNLLGGFDAAGIIWEFFERHRTVP